MKRNPVCSVCGSTERVWTRFGKRHFCQKPECQAVCHTEYQTARAEYEKEHKAAEAALPMCEVDGCHSKGRYSVGHENVRMCRKHLTAAKNAASGMGIFGMFVRWDRKTTLGLVKA